MTDPNRLCLMIVSVGFFLFGPIAMLGAHSSLTGVIYWAYDLLMWPWDGAQDLSARETRFTMAILGGIISAWGLVLILLVKDGLDQAPALSRKLIGVSATAWFVIDSAGSVLSGTASNVPPNILFYLMFIIPIWNLSRQAQAQ